MEFIGTDIDHRMKHASATTEPAWNDGRVGVSPGLFVWRIEDFAAAEVLRDMHGQFFEGDSYIILFTEEIPSSQESEEGGSGRDRLGAHTSQDEAGIAAYKTVDLDEFLHGAATKHRELQANPSDEFLALFPRLTVRRGGVTSGFRHVEVEDQGAEAKKTLLRVFRQSQNAKTLVVHEVEPTWRSLGEEDVFILDRGDGTVCVW